MAERKVLNKYYPPDYDPSKIPRVKRKDKPNDVRIMAPFNLRCNTCGNYISSATKFNAKKETIEDQTYKSLMIFRFHIKCPRCMASIIFKTNPKERGYEVELGATENFMALKMAERQAQEEAEAEEEEEKINPMKHLENRTKASKQQMEASEQIHCLRTIKHRFHSVDIDAVLESKRQEAAVEQAPRLSIQGGEEDDDIRAEAREILKRKVTDSDPRESTKTMISSVSTSAKQAPKLSSSLMNLKKKIKIVPKATNSNAATGTGEASSNRSNEDK